MVAPEKIEQLVRLVTEVERCVVTTAADGFVVHLVPRPPEVLDAVTAELGRHFPPELFEVVSGDPPAR